MKKCNPEGRDCIEKNSILSFNCSVTCKGLYADVQWMENRLDDDIGDELDEQEVEIIATVGDELQKEMYQRLAALERKMKSSNGGKGEEMDREKKRMLIKEYKKFKRDNTRHITFNSVAKSTKFGESSFFYSIYLI